MKNETKNTAPVATSAAETATADSKLKVTPIIPISPEEKIRLEAQRASDALREKMNRIKEMQYLYTGFHSIEVTETLLNELALGTGDEHTSGGYGVSKLVITDTNRREFTTQNPVLITKLKDCLQKIIAERKQEIVNKIKEFDLEKL